MRIFGRFLIGALLILGLGSGTQAADTTTLTPLKLDLSAESMATLRSRGPEALDELFAVRDQISNSLKSLTNAEEIVSRQKQIEQLDAAIDQVGGQLYCSASRLFWYTDMEKAKAAAKETGRPILSLRMLGKLTDEYSCANSRFFRTTLYANEKVSETLREHFVLYWESVRPVPRLTVDFGDGRKLERTVTGNSIHYIMTPSEEVVDALPGLYGPAAFLRHLHLAETMAKSLIIVPQEQRAEALKQYHASRMSEINLAWEQDLEKLGVAKMDSPEPTFALTVPAEKIKMLERMVPQAIPNQPAAPPAAIKAAEVARPKGMVENRFIRNLAGKTNGIERAAELERKTNDALWDALANLHAEDAELDQNTRELIAKENPSAAAAVRIAITKKFVESPLVRVLRQFHTSIAQDSIRNEYLLHRKIHEWFVTGKAPADLKQLNEKVYTELFLTPSSDPWLGLVSPDTYTGLKNNGIVTTAAPAKQ